MRFTNSFFGGTAMLASILFAPAARASALVVPDPEYFEQFSIGNGVYQFQGFNPGNFTAPCAAGPGAATCGTIGLAISPEASVSASLTTTSGQTSTLESEVAYFYEIVDHGSALANAPGTTLIPLVVTGFVSFTTSIGQNTSIGGTQLNFADLSANGQAANGATVSTDGSSTAQAGPHAVTLNINAFSYTPNAIIMRVFLSMVNNGDASSTIFGLVDPVVSFAPGFDASAYDLVVSPGVANAQVAAPEPASFLLAGFALAAVFLLLRGRRDA